MTGVTKHIFEHDIRDILTMWNRQIKSIQFVLPQLYTEADLVSSLRHFYPHEWKSVESKYEYYKKKDKLLKKYSGKARFNMEKPEVLIARSTMFKKILQLDYRERYLNNYSEERRVREETELWKKRKPKIEKINGKIERTLDKTQQVTPTFINQLIGLYNKKNTCQKDRVYILLELKKYYSPIIVQFFFKLNDTELNKQLRNEAFLYLQSFNYQPRARKQKYMQVHVKNSKRKEYLKKIYPDETYHIPKNPNELEYRINNSKEQKIKEYDYFISHSSKDSILVQKLIKEENKQGKNVFCDWINDSDYLKRHLVCRATLKVIEKRLEQSKALIFVSSENSLNSIWCKYELNYFRELDRPIYYIDIENIDKANFDLNFLENHWYVDLNYKNLTLLKGS